MDIGITVLGLAVGFLVGLTGVGGAALLTPLLVMLGIPPTMAVGTDLFYNSITKLFGTFQHYRQKTIRMKLAGYLAVGSVPGAALAILLLRTFETFFHNQEHLVKTILGLMLVLVSAATIVRLFFDQKLHSLAGPPRPVEQHVGLTIGMGALLGFVVGLTSVGSGSLFAIAFLYFYRLKGAEVVGTDIGHALILTAVAGSLHAGLGHVDFRLAANLVGSTLSARVPAKPLRVIMAAMILLTGLKLL